MRDQVVDFVRRRSEKTDIGAGQFVAWLGVTASKFYSWRERCGKANEHNAWVPMDMLAGRRKEIQAVRDRKLEEARRKSQLQRRAAA